VDAVGPGLGDGPSDPVAWFVEHRGEWSLWQDWMRRGGRCEAGQQAGLWALGVLEKHLGSDWLQRVVSAEGTPPAEVAWAISHAAPYAELLRWAARLEACAALPGFAQVRRQLRQDLREEAREHCMLQLELAALATRVGWEAAFERRMVAGPPVDVHVIAPTGELAVEMFTVLTDDQLQAEQRLAEMISSKVSQIEFVHKVFFAGRVTNPLTAETAVSFIAAVEAAARQVVATGEPQRVNHPLVEMEALPNALATPGTVRELPLGPGRGWERTAARLRQKAGQAASSGATWLRLDVEDTMWQLTPWAQQPLHRKTIELAEAACEAVAGVDHLHGLVLSSGTTTALMDRSGASTWPPGRHLGLRRAISELEARETIVVGLGEYAEEQRLWFELYGTEPTWLDEQLDRVGFPSLSTLARPSGPA